jgi:pyruvate/2-oxoglutarate dehydrogenase complex dihydrolipoamide acyltransferase (E2) component
MNAGRLTALIWLSCAAMGAAAQDPASAPATDPSAAAAATDAGQATIVFFRPRKLMGAAVGFKVREAGVELGKLRNGTYFVLKVAPGRHQYVVHSETEDVLTLEAEAGETYYVQGSLGMGVVAGRPNLSPSDQATFDSMKAKLKEKPPLGTDDAPDATEQD